MTRARWMLLEWLLLLVLLFLLLSGCAKPDAPEVFGPAIVLSPPAPSPHVAPSVALAPAAAALERDTAALRVQARGYVARVGSKAETIDRLTTLTLQSRRSLERLRGNKTARGYRPVDVVAARVAADALAAFLQTQVPSPVSAPAVTINPEWSGP